ncbi:MAG: HAD family hydrolase [Ignavibacteria bacterium]
MIRNVIFDLGNVLVNVEYERFRQKIYQNGVSEEKYNSFFKGARYRILGYEAGEISTEEFTAKCINELGLKMTDDEFAFAFNDMFSEITEMKALVSRLAANGKHNLFLLSNTSPLHFEHIKKNFGFVNMLHKFALSYELRSLKPDAAIYERTIRHLGIIPEESIFIDDLRENCEAAEKFGFNTINYDKKNHREFVKQFDFLVDSQ